MSGYPDGNPKTAAGASKVPLHLVPPSAVHYLALAFKDGAAKYGPYNWRDMGVSATVYYSAALRHLAAWFDGEEVSQDALVHHLGHVMACCAIVLDAASVGMLNDDRPTRGAAGRLQAKYASQSTELPAAQQPVMVELAEGVTATLIPPDIAAAMIRDRVLATDDDAGEPFQIPGCGTGACRGD